MIEFLIVFFTVIAMMSLLALIGYLAARGVTG